MSLLAAASLAAMVNSSASPSLTAEDALRYDAAWLPQRVLCDLGQLPLDVGQLDSGEAAFIALTTCIHSVNRVRWA